LGLLITAGRRDRESLLQCTSRSRDIDVGAIHQLGGKSTWNSCHVCLDVYGMGPESCLKSGGVKERVVLTSCSPCIVSHPSHMISIPSKIHLPPYEQDNKHVEAVFPLIERLHN
jgi:hypothetical protein